MTHTTRGTPDALTESDLMTYHHLGNQRSNHCCLNKAVKKSQANAVASVCLAITVTYAIAYSWPRGPQLAQAKAKFAHAIHGKRPVEGRLSWDLPYTPPDHLALPVEQERAPLTTSRKSESELELRRAAHALLKAARIATSAESAITLGVLRLLEQRPDRAIEHFLHATHLAPIDASGWSDLGATYIERARRQNDPADYLLALEALEEAVALAPTHPSVLFNHALVLMRLSLRRQAKTAWMAYLEVDPQSSWADEARGHLSALLIADDGQWPELRPLLDAAVVDSQFVEWIVSQHPHQIVRYVQDDLLGRWSDALVERRGPEAATALNLAHRISRTLAQSLGEHLPSDIVAAIIQTPPAQQQPLAEGHRAYRDARALYNQHRTAEARPLFESALRTFESIGSPAALLPELYLAIGRFESYDLEPAHQALIQILEHPKAHGYPSLEGLTYWMLGMSHLANGKPLSSLSAYQAALARFELIGAWDNVAAVHSLLAENFRFLGNSQEAWSQAFNALHASALNPDPRQRHRALSLAADVCLTDGHWEAELYLRNEVVWIARQAGEPVASAHALLQRSQNLTRLGRNERGAQDLNEAFEQLGSIGDSAKRQRVKADLVVAESNLLVETAPSESEAALTHALDFYAGNGNQYPLSRLFLARGRVRRTAGDLNGALSDLRRGIEIFEAQRETVEDEALQISFFDQSETLFDEAIHLTLAEGDAIAAFSYTEMKRSRSLLNRLDNFPSLSQRVPNNIGDISRPLSAHEIQLALPSDVAVVEYDVLEDRIAVWILRPDETMKLNQQMIEAQEVEETVARLLGALRAQPEEFSSASRELYDMLIRPVLNAGISARDRLVLIPDQTLSAVPFAALSNRDSGRYIIQDHDLTIAPSASFYVRSLPAEPRIPIARSLTALVIGDPTLHQKFLGSLPDLPEAMTEASTIAEIYPGSLLLTGNQATRSRFLEAVDQHDIIHIASHAELNEEYPLLSYLLLATSAPSDSGALYAHEVYGLKLEKPKLVVLSACRTASGPTTLEGVSSLARAFLASGVPAVVASLWNVEDAATSELFRVFYQELSTGAGTANALRQAQLALLHHENEQFRHPRSWAAFEVLGALDG